MEDREVLTLGDTDELMTEATAAADDLVERVGIE